MMNNKEKINEMGKKAEKFLIEPPTLDHFPEVVGKVHILAGSAKLVRQQVEENWRLEKLLT